MSVLNKKTCLVTGANVGYGDCVLIPAHIAGAILTPSNFELTAEDLASPETVRAALLAAASNANPRARIYPIHHFEQVTPNTEDKTIQTLGYGGKYPVREGDYDWTFQFIQGGLCLLKSLRNFNGTGRSVLFYDANGTIIGWKVGQSLRAIPLVYFWANPWTPNDGSNAAVFSSQFVFKPRYINDEVGFIETNFPVETIAGLQDIVLREDETSANPALEIIATTGCSGDSIYEIYAAELATPDAWVADNGAITVTSVAENAAIGGWTVTLESPASTVTLADTEVLAGLGVEGFEAKVLTL